MIRLYTYNYQILPTKEQKILISKHCGTMRFLWNKYLAQRGEVYKTENRHINYHDQAKEIVQLKKQEEFKWLKEINSQSIQQCLDQLDKAFYKFFKKQAGYPNFKSKNNGGGFRIPQHIEIRGNLICFPKFREGIKIKLHRELVYNEIKFCTVTKKDNKYFVSITVTKDMQPLEKTGAVVGIDLGIKDLIITSDGKKYDNPQALQKHEHRLRNYQKKLCRQVKGSNSRNKTRRKLAKVHSRITNLRKNTIHNITTELVRKNDVIVIEDLNVRGMLQNHKLAKAVSNVSFFEVKRQLEYKCTWYGKELVKINRWYPSSKTCNKCGYINSHLTLNDRMWECPQCASILDRDINAAQNILEEGLRTVYLIKNTAAMAGINGRGVESKTTPDYVLVGGNAATLNLQAPTLARCN